MNTFHKQDAQKVIDELSDLNEKFSGKTILITGAAGFIGGHLVHYFLLLNDSLLLNKKCSVIAWDNLIRDTPEWLQELKQRKDFIFEHKNIATERVVNKIDFIIHAASVASPRFYRKYPLETMDANVTGTRNLLEYAKANDVEGFLYLSTSEIYGNPDAQNIPTKEEYWGNVNNLGPRACYDESKRYAETLCMYFFKLFQTPVKIVRPFNNYGVGLAPNDGRVISDFLRDAILYNKIILLSNGKTTRTFCYISDAIAGFLRVLLSVYNGEAFNIGAANPEITIAALAEKIRLLRGNKCIIESGVSNDLEYNTDCPERRCPDISKARNLVGYKTLISVDSGLEATYKYYKKLLLKYN